MNPEKESRRQFLQRLAYTALGLGLSSCAPPKPDQKIEKEKEEDLRLEVLPTKPPRKYYGSRPTPNPRFSKKCAVTTFITLEEKDLNGLNADRHARARCRSFGLQGRNTRQKHSESEYDTTTFEVCCK